MKRNNLHVRVMIAGFLLILIFVIAVFCLTFCNRTNITPELSSSISEIEELTTETTVATTETSSYTSTETTTLVDETTTTTLAEKSTTTEVTTGTVLEQKPETLQTSTSASAELTTEMTSTLQTTIATTTTSVITLSSIEEIAKEVWQGLWGAGDERKERLEAAGYNYDEVQEAVCQIRNESKTNPNPVEDTPSGLQIQFVKTFSRGTYYAYGGPRKGGSGRQLIDCSQGSGGIKGSIASWYLYNNYGYSYGGERTTVYLEVEGYPQMNGFYYLDDSCAPGYNDVIDFFFLYNSNCPFQHQGVVKVNCSIVK